MEQQAILTKELGRKFPAGGLFAGNRWVLRDVNLDIRGSETFGLIGQNGAGKSTLLKILSGLLRPTTGRARIAGGDPRNTLTRRALGFLPEIPHLYGDLSVRETLILQAALYGLRGDQARQAAARVTDDFGLHHHIDARVSVCSKGTIQRLTLAAVLLPDPDVLVLDEPFSGLDPSVRHRLNTTLHSLHERGRTVLLCAHELAEIARHCDRVGILHRGRIQDVLHRDEYGGSAERLEEFYLEFTGEAAH